MKENINNLINFWKEKYRILCDWDIEYVDDEKDFISKCRVYPTLRKAYIGEFEMIVKGEVNEIHNYIKHEMLHIAISAMKQDESEILDLEELFVQDLCKLIKC